MNKPLSHSLNYEGELLPEYHFNYQKAKPNRFAFARRYFVYIIESPSSTDILDGRTEGRVLEEALKLAEIPRFYSLVTTEKTLDVALDDRLQDAWKLFGQSSKPILHLSMHGSDRGVVLTDGTSFSWEQLQQTLAPLNNDLQGRLLICMSSCSGAFAIQMAKYCRKTDQPFDILVGNKKSVSWSDAAVAYITFYHLLFKGMPVEQCVKQMKKASGNENFEILSGHGLKEGWTEYVKNKNCQTR